METTEQNNQELIVSIKPAVKPENDIKKEIKQPKKRGRKKDIKNKKIKETKAIDKLSPRYKIFVKNYIDCIYNGTRAYMMTYPKSRPETARIKASQLLAKLNIKKAVEEESKEYFKNKDSEREKSETYKLIYSIAKTPISDIVDLEGRTLIVKDLKEIPEFAVHAVKSIEYIKKETQYGIDENIKIVLHDKLSALKLRAQMQGLIDKEGPSLDIIIKAAEKPEEEKEK